MQDIQTEGKEEGDPDHVQRMQYAPVPVELIFAATIAVVSTGLLPLSLYS